MAERAITATSPDYQRRREDWRRVRDALDGQRRIKERGTDYLPKPKGQRPRDYDAYLTRASFYAVADRTLRGLTGLVFRTAPEVTLPPALDVRVRALTPEGFSAIQTLREAVREILSLGRYGILVDLQRQSTTRPTPYLATYLAEDIVRWEEKFFEATAERVVTRVVLREEPTNADDRSEVIIRELFLDDGLVTGRPGTYVQQLWREVISERDVNESRRGFISRDEQTEVLSGNFERMGPPIIPTRFNQPLDRIPFWFVNVFDHRPRTDKPPMLDLVDTNVAHYRNSADYEQSLFLSAAPTPWMTGVDEGNVPKAIGPGQIWWSTNPDAKVGYLELQGISIPEIRAAMKEKEERMAAQGARLINDFSEVPNVTAETVRLQTRAETSILVAGVGSVQEAFEQALRFAASWAGASEDAVAIKLNTDFIETRLGPQELTALVAAWQSGAISRETLHANLQRGEVVDVNRTLDEEKASIEDDDATMIGQADELDGRMEEIARRVAGETNGGGDDDAGSPSTEDEE